MSCKLNWDENKSNQISSNAMPATVSVPSLQVKLDKFTHVPVSKVRAIILSTSNATCQLDPIPTWLVNKCINTLAPVITRMINYSLDSGHIPKDWKTSIITPLIKKADQDPILENVWPVDN